VAVTLGFGERAVDVPEDGLEHTGTSPQRSPARAGEGKARREARIDRSASGDNPCKVRGGGAKRDQRPEQKVDRNTGITRFHLGHTGLARPDYSCKLTLCQAPLHALELQAICKTKAKLDERLFFRG